MIDIDRNKPNFSTIYIAQPSEECNHMKYSKPLVFSLVFGLLAVSGLSPVKADTTETTIKTTTTTTGASVMSLPATGTYLVVDPITGVVQGSYDPEAPLILQSGLVIVDSSTGRLLATVDSFGNLVDVNAAPATEVLVVSIDARRRDLDRQIAEALNGGQLTRAQANALRADLARIASDESASRQSAGTLTYQKAMILGYGLNSLSDRLAPVTQTVVATPVISPQFVTIDGNVTMVDNVTYRRLQLQARIDDEYASGRLSGDQVSRLKSDLDKISSLETNFRRDGQLSDSKNWILSIKLDRLQSSLENNVAVINQRRSGIGIRAD